ncbi:MAG: hypothetical protein KC516_01400 [Nanoarchaeota archaeon]|nr:hypothetical protein [Nanoarchaeota archaeon]
MKNKRGLSTVVTTLIIILLVLVAVGIIWGVVSNLLENSRKKIQYSTSCLDVEIRALSVVEYTDSYLNNVYNVTLQRTSTGESGAVFAKFTLFSDESNTKVLNFEEENEAYPLEPLTTKKISFISTFQNATRIEVTPYLLDDQGNEFICATTTIKNF